MILFDTGLAKNAIRVYPFSKKRMIHLSGHALRVGLVRGISCPVLGLPVGSMHHGCLTPQQLASLFLCASLPLVGLNFLVVERFNQEAEKVTSIVLVGNILALVFVLIGLFLGLRV